MNNIIINESCGGCKFFRRHLEAPDEGFCKRFPPIVIVAPIKRRDGTTGPAPVSATPNMHESEWCGEYKMKVTLQ